MSRYPLTHEQARCNPLEILEAGDSAGGKSRVFVVVDQKSQDASTYSTVIWQWLD